MNELRRNVQLVSEIHARVAAMRLDAETRREAAAEKKRVEDAELAAEEAARREERNRARWDDLGEDLIARVLLSAPDARSYAAIACVCRQLRKIALPPNAGRAAMSDSDSDDSDDSDLFDSDLSDDRGRRREDASTSASTSASSAPSRRRPQPLLVGGALEDGWERLCRAEWGVYHASPSDVPCVESRLGVIEHFQDEVFDDLARRWGDGDACAWDGGAGCGGGWRAVYRDRHLGWKQTMETLRWLKARGHPSDVSGRRHRYELFLAMRYAAVCTDCVGDVGGRKSELIACDGVKSLRALIDGNESANLVEQACCALANVLHGDRETPGRPARAAVMKGVAERVGGALLTLLMPLLTSTCVGVRTEATRIFLSVESPFERGLESIDRGAGAGVGVGGDFVAPPEVVVGEPRGIDATKSRPLPPGTYTLHEYFSSGDLVHPDGQVMYLEYTELDADADADADARRREGFAAGAVGVVAGRGTDASGPFTLSGAVDATTGEFVFEIAHQEGGGEVRTYRGLQDAAPGVWGLSAPVRSASTFSLSTHAPPPRPFRLWHTPDILWVK